MGNVRIATLLLFAFTYYVLCSCKFSSQNQFPDSSNFFRRSLTTLHRQQHSGFAMDGTRSTGLLPQKRSKQFENFVELPSTEVYEAPLPGFERIPYNEYNRIVSALKEMLRARDEKPIILRPRPGRRSMGADFPLWHYLLNDAGDVGLNADDNVALVSEAADALADTTLKKSAPFKPRLGKRCGSRICE